VFQRHCDVAVLTPLGAATEQDDDRFTIPAEVHSIAGAAVDPQFGGTLADRLCIRGVAVSEAPKRGRNDGGGLEVESIEPLTEWALVCLRSVDFDPDHRVSFTALNGKSSSPPVHGKGPLVRGEKEQGRLVAAVVVFTSIRRSCPDRSKERMS